MTSRSATGGGMIGVCGLTRRSSMRTNMLPAVVVTLTLIGEMLPLVTCTVAGTTHVAPCGAPVHCTCAVPENPLAGVTVKANCAGVPALTVLLFELLGATVNGLVALPVSETV